MAHDVFISYSSQDKTVADAVCASLEAKKIRCWIAPRDVLPGIPYAEALIDGLNRSRIIVLVFSANSNKSPQVMREVERSVNKGIPIIPLRIEDVIPSKSMEYFVSSSHWLDALTPPLEKHLQRLADSVQTFLANQAQKLPGQEPEPTTPKPTSHVKWWNKVRRIYLVVGSAVLVLVIVGVIFLVGGFGRREIVPTGASPTIPSQTAPAATTPPSASIPPTSASKETRLQYDFSSPISGWGRYSDENGEGDYVNGEYSFLVKKWDWRLFNVNRNEQRFRDLLLEIDARLVSGPDNSRYGVVFRWQDGNNYYCFYISGKGDYMIQKRVKGAYTLLQSKAAPTFINGSNVTNHLKVVCKGSQIEVYCNGYQLATVMDTSLAEGWVGASVYSAEPPACAHFDNLSISSVD